ncbi:MAG TPA: hypothetical protein VHV47_12905, partial [Opitutaceae bacterium]|nr:hypothetical protein [Opitutaceae bacterium]
KLSLLRFLLPPEIMKGDIPDYRVMSVSKVGNTVDDANNWTDTSSAHLGGGDRLFVSIRTELDHFNKANPGTGWIPQHTYQYKLESQVKDRLVFIHSELSPHYYSSARFKAAFFQREPEPITHGKVYFHGTGRFTLFRIIHPSPRLRVMIDFTRTSLGAGRTLLPAHAIVVGEDNYPLPFVGYGSARIVSPIIQPEYFEQSPYITIDFGEAGRPIETAKQGLMRLWGLQYNLDDRHLVGFTRDISILTDEEYLALPRPTRIGDFPGDLFRYPGLEYSGLYEDGWVASDAYFKLGASHPGQVLRLRGLIPDIPSFRTRGVDVTVSINGTPTEIVNLKPGEFSLTRLIKEAVPITSISLHFSDAEVYAGGSDTRVVSASIHEIAIVDSADLAGFRQQANGGGRLQLQGVDADGWIARSAQFVSPKLDDFQVLKLDLEMPGWAPVPANSLQVLEDGRALGRSDPARATYQSVMVPLEAGATHTVELRSGGDFPLPGESRRRSFLIKNISLENVGPSDLFLRGWHPSGYLFSIHGADGDGWVDRRLSLRFPATALFKAAEVQVIRFPARGDLPLSTAVDGGKAAARHLQLETPDTVEIPLSTSQDTSAELTAPRDYPLAAPDTRSRSFRILKIDFR